jgi:hypothetical protein
MQNKQPNTTISSPAISWVDVVTLAVGLIALTLGLAGMDFMNPTKVTLMALPVRWCCAEIGLRQP